MEVFCTGKDTVHIYCTFSIFEQGLYKIELQRSVTCLFILTKYNCPS